jgi:hypothetical protein
MLASVGIGHQNSPLFAMYLSVGADGGGYTISVPIKMRYLKRATSAEDDGRAGTQARSHRRPAGERVGLFQNIAANTQPALVCESVPGTLFCSQGKSSPRGLCPRAVPRPCALVQQPT